MTMSLLRLATAAALGAGGLASATAPAGAQDLLVAVTQLPVHLDPSNLNRNVNTRFNENVFETLIVYDPETGGFLPGLAEAWEMVSPTVMELTLREGVTCHNGEAFTTEDVAVMLGAERLFEEGSPAYEVGKRQFFPTLSGVEVVDERTVRLSTAEPDPIFALRLTVDGAAIPCADAFRAAEGWEEWGLAPVGTGPYRVDEIRPGEFHRFARFDGYWGEPAPLASFTFQIVPETGARIAGLLAGEFDIIAEITPDHFGTIEASGRARIEGGPVNNIRVIAYDRNHPAMSDPRVRQAMNLAIDRELIVETIFAGRTDVPQGMQMREYGPMFVETHEPTGFDPERARALLAEAGYDGTPIAYRYMNDYYAGEVTAAEILREMWRAVGLDIRLELKENWDGVMALDGRGVINYSSTAWFPDPSTQIVRTFGPGGPLQTRGFGSDAEFDRNAAAMGAPDAEIRRDAFEAMLAIFETDAPGTYLHRLPVFYAVRDGIAWEAGERVFMDFRAGRIAVD